MILNSQVEQEWHFNERLKKINWSSEWCPSDSRVELGETKFAKLKQFYVTRLTLMLENYSTNYTILYELTRLCFRHIGALLNTNH